MESLASFALCVFDDLSLEAQSSHKIALITCPAHALCTPWVYGRAVTLPDRQWTLTQPSDTNLLSLEGKCPVYD